MHHQLNNNRQHRAIVLSTIGFLVPFILVFLYQALVVHAADPDLVSQINSVQIDVLTTHTVTVRGTVIESSGVADAIASGGSIPVRAVVWRYPDASVSNEVTSSISSPVLAGGSVSAPPITVDIPWTAGSYRISFCVDEPPTPNGVVAESEENNNCVMHTSSINVQSPDLTAVMNSIDFAPYDPGDTVTLRGSLYTSAPVNGGVSGRFQIDYPGGLPYDEDFVDVAPVNVPLGTPVSRTATWTIPNDIPGTYQIRFCADFPSPGSIAESNEGNNCSSLPKTFSILPDLISTNHISYQILSNLVKIEADITNIGNIFADSGGGGISYIVGAIPEGNPPNPYLPYIPAISKTPAEIYSPFPAGDVLHISALIAPSDLSSGTYRFFVCVDSSDEVVEFGEGDSNCLFVPGTFDPAPPPPDPGPPPECSDGEDNDGDGWTDFDGGDPGCDNADDSTEDPNPDCSNLLDDDGDTFYDLDDPQCSDITDNNEGVTEMAEKQVFLSAYPQRVPHNSRVVLIRSASNVASCDLKDGDDTVINHVDAIDGVVAEDTFITADPVTEETTFVFSCDGGAASASIVVKILPIPAVR